MANESHEAAFYVVFDAEVLGRHPSSRWVRKVRARRVAQNLPGLTGGEIAIKFNVRIPDQAFLRLTPDVVIDVAEGFWTSQPVHVAVEPAPDEEG